MNKLALTFVRGQVVHTGDYIECDYNGKSRFGQVESIEVDNSGLSVANLRVKVDGGYRMFNCGRIENFKVVN